MTLATVRQRLLDQGGGGTLDWNLAVQADRVISDAYQSILRLRPWVVALKNTQVWVFGPYTTGTVSVTNGSATVTGSGTTWTSAMVGRYISIGDTIPQRILTVPLATSLTIDVAWSGSALSAQTYSIVHLRVGMPSDFERVERLASDTLLLGRTNLTYIDSYDPRRQSRGIPQAYVETGRRGSPTDYLAPEIELWPVPSQDKLYRLTYRAAIPSPTVDAEEFILNEDLVLHKALAMSLGLMHTRTHQQSLLTAAQAHLAAYQEILTEEIRQDRRMRGPLSVVLDAEASVSPVDPANLSFWRDWQSRFRGY